MVPTETTNVSLAVAEAYLVVAAATAFTVHVPTARKVRVVPHSEHPFDEPKLKATFPLGAVALSEYEAPTYALVSDDDVKTIDCICSALTVIDWLAIADSYVLLAVAIA